MYDNHIVYMNTVGELFLCAHKGFHCMKIQLHIQNKISAWYYCYQFLQLFQIAVGVLDIHSQIFYAVLHDIP